MGTVPARVTSRAMSDNQSADARRGLTGTDKGAAGCGSLGSRSRFSDRAGTSPSAGAKVIDRIAATRTWRKVFVYAERTNSHPAWPLH